MPARSLFDSARATPHGFREVSAAQLATMGAGVRVIDVRGADEYLGELGHLAGAELVPLDRLSAACRAWDTHAELVLVCRSGRRSAEAARSLTARGFHRVMNLTGGMQAHVASGFPVERS